MRITIVIKKLFLDTLTQYKVKLLVVLYYGE